MNKLELCLLSYKYKIWVTLKSYAPTSTLPQPLSLTGPYRACLLLLLLLLQMNVLLYTLALISALLRNPHCALLSDLKCSLNYFLTQLGLGDF